ncbi:MAG: DNA-protecting protein DprA [Treponema sp.]|nr:DNA-protecting protein DprA [Treponema sp.]
MQKIIKEQYWKQATETKTDLQILLDFSLARITFLNTPEKEILYGKLVNEGGPEKLSELTLDEISCVVMRSFPKAKWNGKENLRQAKRAYEVCKKLKIGFLKFTDSDYPAMLRTISNPPYMIFYRGALEAFSQKSVSVVGTRQLSPEGRKAAFGFAKAAASSGISVISGLAKGADGFAHKGALDASFSLLDKDDCVASLNVGKTVAVLPCCIDEILPGVHVKLAENIIKSGGCLISEYAPFTDFGNWHYVQRNRIIAALSPATVVIEAPNGSGSLITADFALELGRDVMFHKACFGDFAKKINEGVKKNLKNQYNNKLITKHKLEVCCEQFVQDGAPVINDFEDYCKCLSEAPGTRSSNKIQQLELFN